MFQAEEKRRIDKVRAKKRQPQPGPGPNIAVSSDDDSEEIMDHIATSSLDRLRKGTDEENAARGSGRLTLPADKAAISAAAALWKDAAEEGMQCMERVASDQGPIAVAKEMSLVVCDRKLADAASYLQRNQPPLQVHFVHWPSNAPGMHGRVVRLDEEDRIVYSMPSLVPLRDFSKSRIIVHRVGIGMEKVAKHGREKPPPLMLRVRDMAEVASSHGELRALRSSENHRDALQLEVMTALQPCQLCHSMGLKADQAVVQCANCMLHWHPACCTEVASAMWGVTKRKLQLHTDIGVRKPSLRRDELPQLMVTGPRPEQVSRRTRELACFHFSL